MGLVPWGKGEDEGNEDELVSQGEEAASIIAAVEGAVDFCSARHSLTVGILCQTAIGADCKGRHSIGGRPVGFVDDVESAGLAVKVQPRGPEIARPGLGSDGQVIAIGQSEGIEVAGEMGGDKLARTKNGGGMEHPGREQRVFAGHGFDFAWAAALCILHL